MYPQQNFFPLSHAMKLQCELSLFHLFHLWSQICMRWVFLFIYCFFSCYEGQCTQLFHCVTINLATLMVTVKETKHSTTLSNSYSTYIESFFWCGTNTFNKQTSYQHKYNYLILKAINNSWEECFIRYPKQCSPYQAVTGKIYHLKQQF